MFLTTLLPPRKNKSSSFKITHLVIFLLMGLPFSLFLNSCRSNDSNNSAFISQTNNKVARIIRIGYQPLGSPILLKNIGNLEKRLTKTGRDVRWIKYNSGPLIIEAMEKGTVDLGYVGDVPALLAQIKNLPLVVTSQSPLQAIGDEGDR